MLYCEAIAKCSNIFDGSVTTYCVKGEIDESFIDPNSGNEKLFKWISRAAIHCLLLSDFDMRLVGFIRVRSRFIQQSLTHVTEFIMAGTELHLARFEFSVEDLDAEGVAIADNSFVIDAVIRRLLKVIEKWNRVHRKMYDGLPNPNTFNRAGLHWVHIINGHGWIVNSNLRLSGGNLVKVQLSDTFLINHTGNCPNNLTIWEKFIK